MPKRFLCISDQFRPTKMPKTQPSSHKYKYDWLRFEHLAVRHHAEVTGHLTWHQSVIPEEAYMESGIINDFNRLRMRRIMDRRKGANDTLLPDFGLDFLSRNQITGTYHGGQCKMYENARLRSEDCARFFSIRETLLDTKGFLVTSRKDCMERFFAEIVRKMEHDGKLEHVVLPSTNTRPQSLGEPETEITDLRPYQARAVDAVLHSVSNKNLLHMTTGVGKTLIANRILASLRPRILVCVAPLLCSVEQLMSRVSPFLHGYHSVLLDSEGNTDPEAARRVIANNNNANVVVFTTLKSFEALTERLGVLKNKDAFLLIDEVHNLIHKTKACRLANKFERSLYLSATVPEELTSNLDYHTAFTYNLREAINDGICSDYDVFFPHIDADEREFNCEELRHLDTHMCAQSLYLATGMLQQGKRKCIAYFSSIDEAHRFAAVCSEVFERYHGIKAEMYTINCETPKTQRRQILAEFGDDDYGAIKILTNVRILDEAIDVPRCDSIFIAKIGESSIRAAQRLGRAIRIDPNNVSKRAAVFVWSEADNWNDSLPALQLLKEQDPDFHAKVRACGLSYDKQSRAYNIGAVNKTARDVIRFMQIRCLTYDEIFDTRLQLLKEFLDKQNRYPSKRAKDDATEKSLSNWVVLQRWLQNKNKLTEDRVNKIQRTIPDFVWNFDEKFDNSLTALKEFLDKHNRYPSVKAKYGAIEKSLSLWVQRQRCLQNKNKLTEDRVNKIQRTIPDFVWNLDEKKFDNSLTALKEFLDKHNRYPSCKRAKDDASEKSLSQWVYKQRTLQNTNELTEDRVNKIQSAIPDFVWNIDFDEKFDNSLTALKEFLDKHNRYPSAKAKDDATEKSLSWWVNKQRKLQNKNKLTEDRFNKIQRTIPDFVWRVRMDRPM